ncbi:hypothetical protein C0585_03755 [Candidatus Woesearchaeota archaeon]|nr:MAG: hypothetical protein C0585_03755 [Candidatus Woesearchaeota archaeon]
MKQILLVEDSMYTANAVKILLESQDYKVNHLSNGADVLKEDFSNYSLMILDLMMPGMSGFEVFDVVTKNDVSKNVPILILTARVDKVEWDSEFKKKLRDFDDVMRKPFDNQELIDKVKEMILE